MAPIIVMLYTFLFTSFGYMFIHNQSIGSAVKVVESFIIGSFVFSMSIVSLVYTNSLSELNLLLIIAVLSFPGLFFAKKLFGDLKICALKTKDALFFRDKYFYWFSAFIVVYFFVLLAMSYTPPRAGDAMRYHLAELNEIVRYGGNVVRPYYCYTRLQRKPYK